MAAESALTDVFAVVSATARALPWTANLMTVLPADRLSVDDAMDTALERAAQRWPDVSETTCATLWWYGSSSTIALVLAAQLLVTGRCVDPRPSSAVVSIGGTGTVEAMSSTSTLSSHDAPDAVADLVDAVIERLCVTTPGLSAASLWAVASDSIANRTLDAATALHRVGDAMDVASALTSRARHHRFPQPRLVDVTVNGGVTPAGHTAPPPGARRFLRRSSCCLVFEAGEDKCVSCPRRTPADRARRWSTLVG